MLTQHPTHGEHVLHATWKKATACEDALCSDQQGAMSCCMLPAITNASSATSLLFSSITASLMLSYVPQAVVASVTAGLGPARSCQCWLVLLLHAKDQAPQVHSSTPPLHCLHRYRPSLRHGLEDQALICSFRFTEENRAVRELVVNAVTTSRAVAAWVSRLGLPVNSIQDKLPYHRSAEAEAAVTWIQGTSSCVMTFIS